MNKAITDGLLLMPPAFADGLDVWSSEDGTPGSATYDGAVNAALVPSDADFGGALEITKSDTVTKLRYMGETPVLPGCYLRITARVKAISGNLPSVRIAGWAGDGSFDHVGGVTETCPEVALTTYGQIVEVTGIVGTGTRGGVDMPWGDAAVYGHFGLDLIGANGGVVRIDDIVIEDITSAFLRDMIDVVDVRDFGAIGDGITDDTAAFEAADAAADGRTILVPAGIFRLTNNVTLTSHVRFNGTVTLPDDKRLSCQKDFNITTYANAFGSDEQGLRRGLAALCHHTDHIAFDLEGRRVELSGPIDVSAVAGGLSTLEVHRRLVNGFISAESSSAWDPQVATSTASYNPNNPLTLTNVTNVANVEVGSVIAGNGVGREVYVRDRNIGAQTITLSQPLYGPNASQGYTFTRYKYVLDFSGFSKLSKFCIDGIEFQLKGWASGILLAPDGETVHIKDCQFRKVGQHAVSSHGGGCQDLQIDRCTFFSSESPTASPDRVSVGFNVNANDAKIRNNRFQHLGTTAVLHGNGHIIVGNHWFHGDDVTDGPRKAGLVFTQPNVKSIITGNYIDNNFIEWTNEHDADPDFANEYSFGGLTVTGNIFTCNDVASWFNWIVIKPYGEDHFIQGLSMTGNTFKSLNGSIDRVESVDDSFADLDFGRTRNVEFSGNTFNGISQPTINPVTLEFTQGSTASTWTLDVGAYLPFGGWSRTVSAVVPEGPVKNGSGSTVFAAPFVTTNVGVDNNMVQLGWPEAVQGTVHITARVDRPV
ncbi:glycosyl hydrolase family 28-related protein [Aliiroseovarius sp. PTFE2010]|uniref:glycosyl hydrolase family 28-related protein n=1 Tax=Aliiroseovarius sp. PTFE2010 TaxID=3417190 RepID=UPI003CF31685